MQQSKLIGFVLLVLFAVVAADMVPAQAATETMTDADTQTGDEPEDADMTNMSDTGEASEDMTDESSEIIELEQVSVTTSRRREKVLEAPASVAVVGSSRIKDSVTSTVADHVTSVRAVDVAKTGLGSSHIVVRGFNNVFSGSLLSLVDNRIARVPSIRLNAYSLIPTSNADIEQIEVVSGPGAALYGPNSANGVMHILTRSPFTSQGTTVSIGGGERSALLGSLRHAGVLNETFGYKFSASAFSADDWEEGRAEADLNGVKPPEFDMYRAGGDFRVDYRPNSDFTTIVASGFTQTTGLEMTGIGAGQAKNWTYGYVQGRFIYKDLFAQAFWNRSDAGDTYTVRAGDPIIDNSDLYVGQIQHGYSLGENQRFTYGLDLLLTRPDTEGSINGRNEDNDSVNEVGAYLQSETKILPQLKFIAAARVDDHNHLNDLVFSPRAALSLQPNDDHNFRLTYNRAFSTPSSSNLFLDVVSTPDAFGIGAAFQPALGFSPSIDVRAQGVNSETGFTFKRSENGRPEFRSPFSPAANLPVDAHIPLDDPVFTNVMWSVGRSAILSEAQPLFEAGLKQAFTPEALPELLQSQSPAQVEGIVSTLPAEVTQLLPPAFQEPGAIAALPPEFLQQLIPQILGALPAPVVEGLTTTLIADLSNGFANVIPEQVTGVKNVLLSLNPETEAFEPIADVNNVDPITPTITQTYEVGYKGILMDKIAFSADVYHTRINDFIGPLVVETPNVFLDANSLGASIAQQLTESLSDPKNALLNQALLAFDAPAQGGNGDGSAVDELTKLFVAGTESNGAAFIPFGTVSAEQAGDPNAVMLTYRNYGDISLNGADFSLTYYLNRSLSVTGNYSFVSKDLFETNLQEIALNAPKNKFGANVRYLNTEQGFGAGVTMRYVAGFPMNSGVYIGDVESYYTIDLSAGYDLPIGPKPRLSLTVQNLLDEMHRQFVGAPYIGRLSMLRLTQTF